jgi:hypothetical protein
MSLTSRSAVSTRFGPMNSQRKDKRNPSLLQCQMCSNYMSFIIGLGAEDDSFTWDTATAVASVQAAIVLNYLEENDKLR